MGTRCFIEEYCTEKCIGTSLLVEGDECYLGASGGTFREVACDALPSIAFNFDVTNSSATTDKGFVVIVDDKCIFLGKGSNFKFFTIEYGKVKIEVKEGSIIKKWEVVAEALSRKGTLRKVKSPLEGLLFLIQQDVLSKTEKYVLYIDTSGQARVLRKHERKERFGENSA